MSSDLFFYTVAVLQIVSSLVTIWSSAATSPEDWPKRHSKAITGLLILLPVLTGLAASGQYYKAKLESDASSAGQSRLLSEIASQSKSLGEKTNEIDRVQKLNTSLQEELLHQSKDNTRLAGRVVGEVTGGDSWAWVQFHEAPGGGIPQVVHRGGPRLSDLGIRIVDVRPETQAPYYTVEFEIRSLGKGYGRFGPLVEFRDQSRLDFNIFFSTDYSSWMQEEHHRKVAGRNEFARRVFRGEGVRQRILLQCYSDGFPLSDLTDSVPWGQKRGCGQ